MKHTALTYYVKEGDDKPKGVIDLMEGRGVRSKNQTDGLEWPGEAKNKLAFGLAVEGRTYYFYGSDVQEVKLVIFLVIVLLHDTVYMYYYNYDHFYICIIRSPDYFGNQLCIM